MSQTGTIVLRYEDSEIGFETSIPTNLSAFEIRSQIENFLEKVGHGAREGVESSSWLKYPTLGGPSVTVLGSK